MHRTFGRTCSTDTNCARPAAARVIDAVRPWIGRRLLFVIVGCAVFGFASPAIATRPDRFSFPEEGSEPHFVQCDGFEIGLATTGNIDVTVFFDSAGQVAKFVVHTAVRDTLTNSVTGKTVVNRGVFTELFTRIDGSDQFTHALVGYRFMGTSPGEGLLQDVGRIVYSPGEEQILFLAGQHHVPDPGGEAVFCAALA
jgi:hypothetical protein